MSKNRIKISAISKLVENVKVFVISKDTDREKFLYFTTGWQ